MPEFLYGIVMKDGGPIRCRHIAGYEIDEANRLLEQLASQFPKDAAEYKAIELAAKALLFAFQSGTAAKFRLFLENFDSELTDEQKKRLCDLGIES
jgi:hypothetical protein